MTACTICPDRLLRPLLPLAFWLVVWQLAALAVGQSFILPGPAAVLGTLIQLAGVPSFWQTALLSLVRVLAGLLAGFNFLSAIAVVLIALSLMRLEGRPLLDFDACARDGIHWHVFWITAAALPVSAAVSSDAAGITAWLGEVMNSWFSGANVIVFLVLFSVVINLATQFTHNVSLVLIAVPIAVQVSGSLGLNPLALTVLIVIAAACAYATPAASTVAAVLFSNVDWIGVKNSFKAGFSAVAAGLLVLFAFGFPLIGMVYGFTL